MDRRRARRIHPRPRAGAERLPRRRRAAPHTLTPSQEVVMDRPERPANAGPDPARPEAGREGEPVGGERAKSPGDASAAPRSEGDPVARAESSAAPGSEG